MVGSLPPCSPSVHRYQARPLPHLGWILARALGASAVVVCVVSVLCGKWIKTFEAFLLFVCLQQGWMVFIQDSNLQGRVDISDLNANTILNFQHAHYLPLAVAFGIVIPTAGAGLLWGDWVGGFVWASCARIFFVHTATFFINSLAHTIGDQPYSQRHSSYDSIITAINTLGEGYHNYVCLTSNAICHRLSSPRQFACGFGCFIKIALSAPRVPNGFPQRRELV